VWFAKKDDGAKDYRESRNFTRKNRCIFKWSKKGSVGGGNFQRIMLRQKCLKRRGLIRESFVKEKKSKKTTTQTGANHTWCPHH